MKAGGRRVWVRPQALADTDVFEEGAVRTDDGVQVTVETSGGVHSYKLDVVLEACTSYGVPDHCNLDVLNRATLLRNTKARFASDQIYTYVSEMLIAVNPFRELGLYADAVKATYKGQKVSKLEPHVYAVAEMAYVHMTLHMQSQSLVVSGESGAGKTETNKHLMDYLIWRSGADALSAGDHLAQRIRDTNPLLEAFGNAKTSRNKNSSRFGKYVHIKFSPGFMVIGAEVRTFMLEKSRVTATSGAGERSYHVFYQLLAGSQRPGGGSSSLLGATPEDFSYTSRGGTTRAEGIDDALLFQELDRTMLSSGVTVDEQRDLYDVLAAILFLSKVELSANAEDEAEVGSSAKAALMRAEELLGMSNLGEVFCENVVHSPRSRSVYHIRLTQAAAEKRRDGLAKHVYTLLFNFLVSRMNRGIDCKDKAFKFIGLLDVFGFEAFEKNSFEQLCINLANERLNHFFLARVFEVELALYRMQNLQVPTLAWPDNSKVIDLLDKSPLGIFCSLDAQCKMPRATDEAFCTALHRTHGLHPHFQSLAASKIKGIKLRDEECFVVRHFAGDVCYSCEGFLEKNSDLLPPAFEKKLNESSNALVQELKVVATPAPMSPSKLTARAPRARQGSFTLGELSERYYAAEKQGSRPNLLGMLSARGGAAGNASARNLTNGVVRPGTVGKKFLVGLKTLMRELAITHPYFVRCIKPNSSLRPGDFNGSMVLRQLECSGTIECVKLMQTGYPTRAPYEDLRKRFSYALPEFMLQLPSDKFVAILLLATGCQACDYRLGQDMVFFKANHGHRLQELLQLERFLVAEKIVEHFPTSELASDAAFTEVLPQLESYVVRRKKEREEARRRFHSAARSVLVIQRYLRRKEVRLAARRNSAVVLQASARGTQVRKQLRDAKLNLRETAAALAAAESARLEAEGKARAAAEDSLRAGPHRRELAEREAAAARAEAEAAAEMEASVKLSATASLETARERARALSVYTSKRRAGAEAESGSEFLARALSGLNQGERELFHRWFIVIEPDFCFHRVLMCKGVEFGFQFHNFYGDWELSEEQPIYNGRPHYAHNTMYGGHAHLFHCLDSQYGVTRWVIGPSPGNENGWAFCESDAQTPYEVISKWISWDGFQWHTCENFKFIAKENEMDGLSDEEDEAPDDGAGHVEHKEDHDTTLQQAPQHRKHRAGSDSAPKSSASETGRSAASSNRSTKRRQDSQPSAPKPAARTVLLPPGTSAKSDQAADKAQDPGKATPADLGASTDGEGKRGKSVSSNGSSRASIDASSYTRRVSRLFKKR